jgi:cytochrome c oxidase subunit 4
MAETHNEPSDKMYLAIAASLGGLTIISYIGDLLNMPRGALICLVLIVALVKATLVATFFMHLKFDWTKVKVMIIPAIVLAAVLVFALLPDITLAMREAAAKKPPVEGAKSAQAAPPGH